MIRANRISGQSRCHTLANSLKWFFVSSPHLWLNIVEISFRTIFMFIWRDYKKKNVDASINVFRFWLTTAKNGNGYQYRIKASRTKLIYHVSQLNELDNRTHKTEITFSLTSFSKMVLCGTHLFKMNFIDNLRWMSNNLHKLFEKCMRSARANLMNICGISSVEKSFRC